MAQFEVVRCQNSAKRKSPASCLRPRAGNGTETCGSDLAVSLVPPRDGVRQSAAAVVERTDHYPDIIVSFRTVRMEMSTHDVGGLTERDLRLISDLNTIPTDR